MTSLQFELLDCIHFWAKQRGTSIALSAGERALTYRQLEEELEHLSARFEDIGPLSRIAVLATQKLATALAVLGGLWRGCSVVILNPRLPADLIAHCIEDATPVGIIVAPEDADLCRQVRELKASAAALKLIALESQKERSAVAQRGRHAPQPHTEWAILYSSGSTGIPKGIERDFESMQTEFLGWCLELGLGTKTRFYVGRPVFYTGGLVLAMSTLLSGGTAVLNEVLDEDADALIKDIAWSARAAPLDWAFLVPDQVRLLLHSPSAQQIAGSIRGVLVMGAPISGQEKQHLAALLRCSVRESWDNSESLGTITDDEMLHECPDSIGRPFLDDSMCVVDPNGRECPTGTIGRIAGGEIAGFTRYTARPHDTASTKRNGLIVSEDLGWCDSSGRYFIAGRIQERVQIGGRDRHLPLMEADLRAGGLTGAFCLTHRNVGDAVEIGLLFESRTVSAGHVEHCVEQIGSNFHVSRVGDTERLPRTASGKIDRRGAADHLWRNG